MGSVCAVEDINDDNLSDEQNSIDILSDDIQLDSKLSEEGSSEESVYVGDVFTNPDFSEGKINTGGDVYGWNVSKTPGGQGKYDKSKATPYGQIVNEDPEEEIDIEGNALLIEYSDGGMYYISQYIDFTSIKSIKFQYAAPLRMGDIIISVDNDVVYTQSGKAMDWKDVNVDVSNYNFTGVKLFEMSFDGSNFRGNFFLDNFAIVYNDKVSANFEYQSTLNENNVDVKFENKASGNITKIIWDFGDGNNSNDINPTHSFKPGNYNVTLTVYHGETQANYTYLLSLSFPTIDGKMYATVQDAIDNAEEGAVIDIPNDLSENLNVNKTVTLNFNGNKLTGSINVNDGAIVTVNNISDVSSVSTDDSSKLTIADSNINSNLELKSGNIDLNSVNFNNSILTITAANTTLVNVNVANGGIVVNGGKSKITKSNFTDSTNVITQNAGELELTNNIIKNNNNAINITGGSATISYNAIYNNTGNLTLTGATVTNNWFGTNQVTGYESYLRLVLTSTDSEMYPDTEYTIKVEFVPNTGSMYSALNDLTLDFTSTNGDVTSPVVISDNQGELKFTAGAISDEVKFTLLGEDYTLVNDDNPVSIVAKPLDTNLVINSSAKGVVVIKLTTAEGNVVGAIVSYSINGAEKINATTDDHGEIIIKDLTGKVEINATYAGNKTLNPITGNGAFDFTETTDNKTNTSSDSKPTTTTPTQTATAKTVKVASKIVAKKKTFKVKTKTKKYKITLKTKSGKAIKKVKVTLKVKGKTYKAKTNAKGVATFKITKLNKKGKYTAKIKFAGNKSYKATSKKIKLTVKK